MKILVLDDHPAIQKYVEKAISSILPNAEISLCSNIDSARQILNEKPRINFVICDLEINSGINIVIPELCDNYEIPFMIYSSHVNKVLISELLELDVLCYVSKTSGIDILHKGIESLLLNKKYFCPFVNLTMESKEIYKETERLSLSRGQKAVLEVLAKGFNRKEAAKLLKIKESTLNNHIARARVTNFCENYEELLRRYRFWDLLF